MTTLRTPVLTDEDIKIALAKAGFSVVVAGRYALEAGRAIEQAVLERAGADAVRDATLEEAARLMNPCDDEGTLGAMNAASIRALKVTPAAAVPANEIVCKGSMALGSGCGKCARCHDEIAPAAAVAEVSPDPCPRCGGSGSVVEWSDSSPDAYERDVDCDHCGGTGSSVDAALKLAAELSAKKLAHMQLWNEYRNFHRSLCSRFGYSHDQVHFRRDLVSLEEAIAGQLSGNAGEVDAAELVALLPGTYYMDEPDGGSATLMEQLQRMAKDAERYRAIRNPPYSDQYGDLYAMSFQGDGDIVVKRAALDDAADAAIAASKGANHG